MGDHQHRGKYNSTSIKTKPDILWKVQTGGQVISSPVVADNTLYIGSEDHKLYAINANTGEVEWEFKSDGSINSTPAVSQGKIMFLSYDGFFYALNQADGKIVWKFDTGGERKYEVKDYYTGDFKPDFWDFYLSSPVVNDGVVYFGSSDTHIYALDIETGKKEWQHQTGGSVHSSPALYENSLIVGSWDSRIYSLDVRTGLENWTYTTGRDTAQYIWLGIQASPALENNVAYVGSRDANLYALNISTGDTIWTQSDFDLSWLPSSTAMDHKNLYTGSSDSFKFFSIDKKTGAINYKTETNAYTFSSPAIDNEMAYIGSANGRLYGINLESGQINWEFLTIGAATDTLKVFDEFGKFDREKLGLMAENIRDMPGLSALFTKVFVQAGAILSSPVIANQTLYFGSSDGYIYAVTNIK
jgi:outer membrane protein assembly factor BamB